MNQFLLARQERGLPGFHQANPVVDFHVFFRGNGEENHVAGKLFGNARLRQPHRRTHQPRDLGIMATGMCRSGLWIRSWMAGDLECVQFSHQGHRGPRLSATQYCLDPRDGQAILQFQSQFFQRLPDPVCCSMLLEPELRRIHDGLANLNDAITRTVDRPADILFQ